MEHLDILYDHYKDTVVLMKDAQRDRDRFFVIMCILLALLFVFNLDPLSTIINHPADCKEPMGRCINSGNKCNTFFTMGITFVLHNPVYSAQYLF